MSLQGNLSDLPLIDLMQVLAFQNKTGILSVNRDFSQAQICFSESRLYSAFVRHTGRTSQPVNLQGEDALYDLLSWPDGQFNFELVAALPGVNNVNVSWNYIMLEYYRHQNEFERHSQLDALAASRPRLLPNPSVQAQITLEIEEWQVMLQVNNQLTLKEIAANIRFELEQVVKIAQKLEKQGILEMNSTVVALPAKTVEPPTGWQPGAVARQSQTAGWRKEAVYRPDYVPNDTVMAGQRGGNNQRTAKPQVQRGILSSIMAKIRGL